MPSVEERLSALEQRLAALERRAAVGRPPRDEIEAAFGLTWLNRLGAAMVVAGLVLGAAWLNERGYLSAPLRTGALVAGAAAVLALGVRSLRSGAPGRRRFGYGVAAIGALGLYLAPFTASQIDGAVGATTAGAASAALTAGLLVAAVRLRLDALAVLAVLGGLAVPLIAAAGAPAFTPLVIYLTALGAVAVALQRALGWSAPAAIASVGCATYYVAAAWGGFVHAPLAIASLSLYVPAGALSTRRGSAPDWTRQASAVVAAAAAAAICHLLGARLAAGAIGVAVFGTALVGRNATLAVVGAVQVATAIALSAPSSALASIGAGVACALVCLAVGFGWNSSGARGAGIVALAVSLVRMFVVDVWALSAGLRVGAFLLLGVGLLAASFLYSRRADRDAVAPAGASDGP